MLRPKYPDNRFSMSGRKRLSSWLRVKILGTATINMSWCSATGCPVLSQRRSPGEDEEYKWSQARFVDSAALSEGSLTGDSAIFVRPGPDCRRARKREAKICCCLYLRAAASASGDYYSSCFHTDIHRLCTNVPYDWSPPAAAVWKL